MNILTNLQGNPFYMGISIDGVELGRSVLLSVPYSEYANTAINLTGSITEFQISDLQNYLTEEIDGSVTNEIEMPTDAQSGDLAFYNGSSWESIPQGSTGQILTIGTDGNYFWINMFNTPIAITAAATNVLTMGATLNGSVKANGLETTVSFEYGLTTTYGNTIDAVPNTINGNETVNVSALISGLESAQTYHFRIKAENIPGITYGDDMNFTTLSSLSIGDAFEGGIVAYFFQPSDPGYVEGQVHGLIASASDLNNVAWYNGSNMLTGATGLILGTGSSNTSTIITAQGNTGSYAAKNCRDLRDGGFNDWSLPCKNE